MDNNLVKLILMNQLRIMSAMQRLEFFVHQQEIEEDLTEGIKEIQQMLMTSADKLLGDDENWIK